MTQQTRMAVSAFAAMMMLAACGQQSALTGAGARGAAGLGARGAEETPSILVGAGDIAYQSPGAEATAKLLDQIPGIVFTLGDNAYQSGSLDEYQTYFHPTWGRHKARTRPVVGNHEYRTPNAAGYFSYFGAAAGDPAKGYYAYDVNPNWRVMVINSSCADDHAAPNLGPDSEQYQWLANELETHDTKNTVVMWHHPRFSTGAHGDNKETDALWKLAALKGVDIALWGHDHHYERFDPMDGNGRRDDANGVRAFVVGTGGKNHYPFFKLKKKTTVTRDAKTFGVLKLSLYAKHYEWEFLPEAGGTYRDQGRSTVH